MLVGEGGSERCYFPEQHQPQIGAAAVQLREGEQSQWNGPTRRGPAGVEHDRVFAAGHLPGSIDVVVDAEVKMRRECAEALAQQVRKPRARRDVGESLTIALLRPTPLG